MRLLVITALFSSEKLIFTVRERPWFGMYLLATRLACSPVAEKNAHCFPYLFFCNELFLRVTVKMLTYTTRCTKTDTNIKGFESLYF